MIILDKMAALISDCIVLKIVETELHSYDTDNTIYILFDTLKREFVIRGIRTPSSTTDFEPYSFRCSYIKSVCDFISVVIDNSNIVSYSLYNLNDLPCYSEDITQELLDESCYKANEIVGYDNLAFNRKTLRKYVGIVQDLFNSYSVE
jgi:hypothetical protein